MNPKGSNRSPKHPLSFFQTGYLDRKAAVLNDRLLDCCVDEDINKLSIGYMQKSPNQNKLIGTK